MDLVGIREEVNIVFFTDGFQPGHAFLWKIEQQGIPGITDLFIGEIGLGFFAEGIVEFLRRNFTGFKVDKQVVGMVLGEHGVELRHAQVSECFFCQREIEIEEDTAEVEDDILSQDYNLMDN